MKLSGRKLTGKAELQSLVSEVPDLDVAVPFAPRTAGPVLDATAEGEVLADGAIKLEIRSTRDRRGLHAARGPQDHRDREARRAQPHRAQEEVGATHATLRVARLVARLGPAARRAARAGRERADLQDGRRDHASTRSTASSPSCRRSSGTTATSSSTKACSSRSAPSFADYSPAEAYQTATKKNAGKAKIGARGQPRRLLSGPALPDGQDRLQGRSAGRREDRLELRPALGRRRRRREASSTRTGIAASGCRSTTRARAGAVASRPRRAGVRGHGGRRVPRREAQARVGIEVDAPFDARGITLLTYRYKGSENPTADDAERRHLGVRADAAPRAPHLVGAAHRRRVGHRLHLRRPVQLQRHRAAVRLEVPRRDGPDRADEHPR